MNAFAFNSSETALLVTVIELIALLISSPFSEKIVNRSLIVSLGPASPDSRDSPSNQSLIELLLSMNSLPKKYGALLFCCSSFGVVCAAFVV